MSPRPNHLPVWQDFHDTVELADSELVGARFQFTYHCRGALKNHVASFDGIALLTGCQWGNTDHTVILVPIDLKRISMRPGCTDPIHVVREFWIPDSSFPDGYRNRVIKEDIFPEPNTPSTYSTVVINALRGLSAYDLYVQQGGNLPLQQWLQIGGYSQEVMQTINNLVTNLRETLGLDIAEAIQTAHQAMVDAADRAAAQAQASAQSAQQAADSVQQAADRATEQATAQAQAAAQSAQASAESAQQAADSVQQAADLATEQATAQAQAAAQSAQTAESEAEAAQVHAEASQQAADAAAADLADARAKVAQILAAITGIDPSQSTYDAIVAEAAARAAKDAELESSLGQLGLGIKETDEQLNGKKVLSGYTAGAYIAHTSGKVTASDDWGYTDFIPVTTGAVVRAVYKANGIAGVASVAQYQADKTLILTWTSNGYVGERTVTITHEATAYIRATVSMAHITECEVYIDDVLVWNYTGRQSGGISERVAGIDGVDDTPVKNSSNVVRSGGVYDELVSIRENVGSLPAADGIPIEAFYYNDRILGYIAAATGLWTKGSNVDNQSFVLYPCRPNTRYSITGNSEYASSYAILADNSHIIGTAPNYATGCALTTIPLGKTISFVTPDDAAFIYMRVRISNDVCAPSLFMEHPSISDYIDLLKLNSPNRIYYNLAIRYMVDARVDSDTFGDVIFCLTSSIGNESWGCTQMIYIAGAHTVRYFANVDSTSNNFAGVTGTVYYDENGKAMTDGVRLINKQSVAKSAWIEETPPAGAAYMRITCSASYNGKYYVIPYKIDAEQVYGVLDMIENDKELPLIKNSRYGWTESATVSAATTDTTDGTVALLHFSDIHSDYDAAKAIRAFYDKYPTRITDMLSTGDVVYYDYDDDFTFYTENHLTDALMALGNHDAHKAGNWNSLGAQATYEKYFAPYISEWGVVQPTDAATNYLMYYYKDYTPANVRLIVLDGQHQTADQLQWFQDTLSDAMTKAYTVVVASHYLPSTYVEEGIVKKSDGDKTSFHAQPNSEQTTIDSRFKLAAAYADAVESFISSGGKFAVWLCGHHHSDKLAYCNTHPNVLLCAIDQAGYKRGGTAGSRSIGDHCANLVTICPRESLIKIVRIGLHSDRYLRQINVLTYNYKNRKVIANY